MENKNNYSIFDASAFGEYFNKLSKLDRMIYTKKQTGFTNQAENRLSQKVIDNILNSI